MPTKTGQTKEGTALQRSSTQRSSSSAGQESRPAPRRRDRERTMAELQNALEILQSLDQKITLKAVANQANVSPSLINHRYPDFAEQVRALVGRTIRQQRNDTADLLAEAQERNRQLNKQVKDQLAEITQLASVNEALRMELALQSAIAQGKVTKGEFGHPTAPRA